MLYISYINAVEDLIIVGCNFKKYIIPFEQISIYVLLKRIYFFRYM